MTTRIALGLGLAIIGAIALDLVTGSGATLFLARRVVTLLEWMAFWR